MAYISRQSVPKRPLILVVVGIILAFTVLFFIGLAIKKLITKMNPATLPGEQALEGPGISPSAPLPEDIKIIPPDPTAPAEPPAQAPAPLPNDIRIVPPDPNAPSEPPVSPNLPLPDDVKIK